MVINQEIKKRVLEHKQYLIENAHIKEEQIMAVAAYGSMNYGTFVEGQSDVDTKAIYVPTFNELAFKKPKSKEYHLPNGEHCELKDIREMVNMWRKQNINFIEILFTPYAWVNVTYREYWNKFVAIAEDIAHFDENKTIQSICGQAIHTLKQAKNEDGYDTKKIANAIRLKKFFQHYFQNASYWNCIYLTGVDKNEVLVVKYGMVNTTNHLQAAVDYERIIDNLIQTFEKYKEWLVPSLKKTWVDDTLYQIEEQILRRGDI